MEQNAPSAPNRRFIISALLYFSGIFTPLLFIPLMMLLFALIFGFISVVVAKMSQSGAVAAALMYVWILTSMGFPFFLLISFHAWIMRLSPRFGFRKMMLLNVQMLPAIFIIAFVILGHVDTGFSKQTSHVEEIIAFCFMLIFTFFASIVAAFNPIHRILAARQRGE